MAQFNMEAHKMLDVYIHDYLVKKNYSNSARIFQTEAELTSRPSAIDAPGGFLFEWWSVFWDMFILRYNQLGPNNEHTQIRKALKQLKQQKILQSSQQQLLQQMQMQVILQRQIEQQYQQGLRPNIHFRPCPANTNLASENFPRGLMNPTTNITAASSDGSLIGFTGSNRAVNNFPLEGWPLMPQPGPPQPEMSSTRPSQQFRVHPQMRILLSEQQMIKSNQCHQQGGHPMPLGQQLESHNYKHQETEKMSVAGSIRIDAASSNTSGDYNQATKNRTTGKRKQPISSTCAANISGTGNTTILTPSLAPSTLPTQKTEDMILMPTLPREESSSNAHLFPSSSVVTSTQNQFADVDYSVNNGSLSDKIDCLSSSSNPEPKNAATRCLDANQDVALLEAGTICADKVNHCDLSSDGKLIATSRDDNKITLWCMNSREQKCNLEEHTNTVTDLRFGPTSPRLATSSLDQTVKVWDADNPRKSLRTFSGHTAPVMSLDFHPKKEDLICSCDEASEIRYWSIKSRGCTGVSKGGASQVRFQPVHGKYLAAAVQNSVSLIDVETAQVSRYRLKGHATDVLSVSWDLSGEYMASLSEHLIRVWKIHSGGEDCINELSITSKKFHCCVFHPRFPSVLVVGSNQSLELWHMTENKMMPVLGQPTNTLTLSGVAGLVASANDESLIMLWK